MTQIITMASLKGGVGKSNLAVNVGGILSTEHNKRVLLVDADDNRSSSSWFVGSPSRPPFDVAEVDEDARELRKLRGITAYDVIVVDLPGYRGRALADVLTVVQPDLVLTPARAQRVDLDPVATLLPALTMPYRLVFTMTNPGRDKDVEGYAASLQEAGVSVAETRIRVSKGWPRAALERRLVTQKGYAFPSPRTDARALTREVLSILDGQHAQHAAQTPATKTETP